MWSLLCFQIQPLTPQSIPFLHNLLQLTLYIITQAESDPFATHNTSHIKPKSKAYNTVANLFEDDHFIWDALRLWYCLQKSSAKCKFCRKTAKDGQTQDLRCLNWQEREMNYRSTPLVCVSCWHHICVTIKTRDDVWTSMGRAFANPTQVQVYSILCVHVDVKLRTNYRV